jgi:hypothetical protein
MDFGKESFLSLFSMLCFDICTRITHDMMEEKRLVVRPQISYLLSIYAYCFIDYTPT